MTAPATDDRYLSLTELAAYSGLSVRTLTRHIHAAEAPLPHYRIGTRILVRRSEFDSWVRDTGATATARDQSYDDKVREAAASLRRR